MAFTMLDGLERLFRPSEGVFRPSVNLAVFRHLRAMPSEHPHHKF
jgi:hypothetical protein